MTDDEIILRIEAGEKGEKIDKYIICLALAPEGAWVEQSKINDAWCIYHGHSIRNPERPRLWGDSLRYLQPSTSIDDVKFLLDVRRWTVTSEGLATVTADSGEVFISDIKNSPAAALVVAWLKATR